MEISELYITPHETSIQAIQESTNKQNISAEELPSASLTVLDQEYSESYVTEAQIAPDLGYEVDMRREVEPSTGERSQAYFDLRGRELRSGRGDRGGREGGDREECFNFGIL